MMMDGETGNMIHSTVPTHQTNKLTKKEKIMKCIIIVESNCSDTTKESEFNEWYNAIHLPDMMELPEIKSACRYENLNPSENDSKYIAVYEIEADDIGKVLERAGKHVEKKAQQGRMSDLFSLTRNSQFMQIYSLEK